MRDNTTEMRLAALELAVQAITTEVLRLMPADEALERVELRKVTLDAIPDAAPVAEPTPAAPAKRWWVVDRRADVRPSASEQSAKMDADQWDVRHSNDAPHLAIEAATKAEALAEYRRRVAEDTDDVAALREQVATLTRERARLDRAIGDALAEAPNTTRAPQTLGQVVRGLRARAERAEAEVARLTEEGEELKTKLRETQQWWTAASERAEREKAEVARLRALCGDAALTLICATEWHVRGPHGEAGKMHARLTAAARG